MMKCILLMMQAATTGICGVMLRFTQVVVATMHTSFKTIVVAEDVIMTRHGHDAMPAVLLAAI